MSQARLELVLKAGMWLVKVFTPPVMWLFRLVDKVMFK